MESIGLGVEEQDLFQQNAPFHLRVIRALVQICTSNKSGLAPHTLLDIKEFNTGESVAIVVICS